MVPAFSPDFSTGWATHPWTEALLGKKAGGWSQNRSRLTSPEKEDARNGGVKTRARLRLAAGAKTVS